MGRNVIKKNAPAGRAFGMAPHCHCSRLSRTRGAPRRTGGNPCCVPPEQSHGSTTRNPAPYSPSQIRHDGSSDREFVPPICLGKRYPLWWAG